MTNPITNYFSQEKKESVFFITLGLVACTIALYYVFVKQEAYYNGLSYALVAIGVVQLVVGVTIYFRCDLDTVRVNHYVERERKSIGDFEIPRMEEVMRNFVIYRWVEVALIFVGIALFLIGDSRTLSRGLGLGLVIQCVAMLILDHWAERRGRAYLSHLKSLTPADSVHQ